MNGPLHLGSDFLPEHISAYNANKLSARDIAKTFVPSDAFWKIQQSGNSLLTGPRGSGKTTLLRMLQSEALEHWQHENADIARLNVQASGIFVGADRSWNAQLTMTSADIDQGLKTSISWGAFSCHIARSVVRAMSYRTSGPYDPEDIAHLRVSITDAQEETICIALTKIYELPVVCSTFQSVSSEFQSRLRSLGILRRAFLAGRDRQIPSWVDADPFADASSALEAFNSISGENDHKWNLLFDELELVPTSIVDELIGRLRGPEAVLSYKLSISPADHALRALEGRLAAVHGQDYDHVPLTSAFRQPNEKFTRDVISSILRMRQPPIATSLNRLLGASEMDNREYLHAEDANEISVKRSGSDPYAVGSQLWKRYVSLRDKDPSFASYLQSNEVDLEDLGKLSASARSSALRKIRNIVLVRDEYRNDRGRRRSRKTYKIYTGADSLLALPDGNPRMILALAKAILNQIDASSVGRKLTTAEQNRVIDDTLDRFLALIRVQPSSLVDGRAVSLLDLLDAVGTNFSKRLVEEDFNADAPLGFIVDKATHPKIVELVELGVDTGSLIYVARDTAGKLSGSVLGSRFRLAHMLAPRYGLPMRLGRDVSLSGLLPGRWTISSRGSGSRRPAEGNSASPQLRFALTEEE
ncbi:ORC-CDC6 family AAA ATPase [Rhodococcus sp. 06-235-1A]|uniref:ORC-CDC6 family AAA ATPase n=1 Tax=Rhodococcus sp. 06-235-1A TaxID=2022508 RepID=UPI00117BAAA4|nr:hypothetical protein [Rhodococcus sp. 06-235-1A]